MCLLALWFQVLDGAPVVVGANREERYDRPAVGPRLLPGPPRVVAGIDQHAGGTWLGVNQHRLLVAVTNRPAPLPEPTSRSRGLLCRDLLNAHSAAEAADRAMSELATGQFAGANYVCVDAGAGRVVHHGGDGPACLALEPGLHLLTNADLDDPDDVRQRHARGLLPADPPASLDQLLQTAAGLCSHPEIVVRRDGRGTVSSDLVALTTHPARAVYRHAGGPPDRHAYNDVSGLLREVLGPAGVR